MKLYRMIGAIGLILTMASCGYTLKAGKMQYIPDRDSGKKPSFHDPMDLANGQFEHTAVLEANWVWNRTRRVVIDGHKIEYPGILIEPGKHHIEADGRWEHQENVKNWEALKKSIIEDGYVLQSIQKSGKSGDYEIALFAIKGSVLQQTITVRSEKLMQKGTISKVVDFEAGKKYHVDDFRD